MRHLFVASMLTAASLLAGCASVFDGYQQLVAVETVGREGRVLGAICELKNPKGTVSVVTPGIAMVRRAYDDLTVRCEKAGFGPGQITVVSVTKPMAILGGLSGMAVDAGTGAAFEYPPQVKVTLGEPLAQPSLVPGEALVAPPAPVAASLATTAPAPPLSRSAQR